MMTGTNDSNPLRSQLEDDLNNSEWLQKFKAINQLLHSLKDAIAEINSCELRWDTSCNSLIIDCPSAVTARQLQQQQDTIVTIADYAEQITLVSPNSPDIILKA